MSVLFLEYPKCSTCKKAKAWLEGAGVDFMDRHIVENNPTAEELKQWHAKSGLPLKKFLQHQRHALQGNAAQRQTGGHERRGTVCPFGYQRHAGETSPHHRR